MKLGAEVSCASASKAKGVSVSESRKPGCLETAAFSIHEQVSKPFLGLDFKGDGSMSPSRRIPVQLVRSYKKPGVHLKPSRLVPGEQHGA